MMPLLIFTLIPRSHLVVKLKLVVFMYLYIERINLKKHLVRKRNFANSLWNLKKF